MPKLRQFLNTTTRRERFLLFVFFCFLLVFAYIQFVVKPMETKIYAKENQALEREEKTYTETQVDQGLKEIKDDLSSYGLVEEKSREVSEDGGYKLYISLGLNVKEEDLASCLSYLNTLDSLKGQTIKKEDGRVYLDFDLAFSLSLGEGYWPLDQTSRDKGTEESNTLKKSQEISKKEPKSMEKPKEKATQLSKSTQVKDKGEKKAQAKSRPKKKVKSPVKPQPVLEPIERPRVKNSKPLPVKELLLEEEPGKKEGIKENQKLHNFQAFADPKAQPILRAVGSNYQFSFMDTSGDPALYQFTFKPVLAKDLKIDAKSGQLGTIQVYTMSKDQVLQVYSYDEAKSLTDLLIEGVYYTPLPGQITDILCFTISHEEGI